MLTYYKELEIPTKVTFPTLTLNSSHKNTARSLPVSYVAKYESLFNKLKTLHFQLNNLEQKESCFLSFDLDEDYYILKTLIQQRKSEDFFELESQVILSEETSLSKQDNYFDFQWYITVLKLLMKLYPNNYFYQTLFMELRQALKELSSFSDFSYIQEKKPVVLPNAWYITPLGELYNTGDGHKETNLEYPFKRVERLFMSAGNQVCFEAIINSLQKRYLEIKKNQCVSYADCSNFLNYNGYFISLGNVDVKSIWYMHKGKQYSQDVLIDKRNSYERILYRLILGILSAEISLYQFFRNIYCNAQNPKLEYEKVNQLKRDDIFIKCIGLNKIETCLPRTITTSSFHFINDFYNYLSCGWNVNFEYPYIMNQESRSVMEAKNLITEHYVDNQVLKYVRQKKDTEGNIFLSGRKL